MRMPFGRYKGNEVASIPPDYLEWVMDNLSVGSELACEIDSLLRGGAQRSADRRQALVEMVSSLDDKQVAKLHGYAKKLLRTSPPS
jgi:hypothetical protein